MNATTLIDISRTIESGAVVYPGDDPIELEPLCNIGPGCPCNITKLGGWSTHFLTHVDPPRHFIKDGSTLDAIPLTRFAGEAIVIEVEGDAVLPEHLPDGEGIRHMNLLFKTRNSDDQSSHTFNEGHVYVSAAAAQLIADGGANLVGIDYIGIDRYGDEDYPAHYTLLGGNVLILEGLALSHVAPGNYFLFALPLKIANGDGSPVRAVLVPQIQEEPRI